MKSWGVGSLGEFRCLFRPSLSGRSARGIQVTRRPCQNEPLTASHAAWSSSALSKDTKPYLNETTGVSHEPFGSGAARRCLRSGWNLPFAHTAGVTRDEGTCDVTVLLEGLDEVLLGKLEHKVADEGGMGHCPESLLAAMSQKTSVRRNSQFLLGGTRPVGAGVNSCGADSWLASWISTSDCPTNP